MATSMDKLIDLGWKYRFDTFSTYWKQIGDYEVVVSKHINDSCYIVVLVDGENEITLNYNASFKWIIKLSKILNEAEHA